MKSYFILISLALFGAVIGMLGSLGTFPDVDIPTVIDTSANEIAAQNVVDNVEQTSNVITTLIGTGISVVLTTITSVLFVWVVLVGMGVPLVMAVPIQGVIYIIYIWDIVTMVLGRPKPST